MAQQNTDPSGGTARKAAPGPSAKRDETRSYAEDGAGDPGLDDDGDALGADDVQHGSNHLNRLDGGEKLYGQGRKTREGNLNRLKTGSAS